MSFDVADGPSRFYPSDNFSNNNPEQPLTREDSECQRRPSDESDLGPPIEGFSLIFEPSDETIKHELLVAEAATGK